MPAVPNNFGSLTFYNYYFKNGSRQISEASNVLNTSLIRLRASFNITNIEELSLFYKNNKPANTIKIPNLIHAFGKEERTDNEQENGIGAVYDNANPTGNRWVDGSGEPVSYSVVVCFEKETSEVYLDLDDSYIDFSKWSKLPRKEITNLINTSTKSKTPISFKDLGVDGSLVNKDEGGKGGLYGCYVHDIKGSEINKIELWKNEGDDTPEETLNKGGVKIIYATQSAASPKNTPKKTTKYPIKTYLYFIPSPWKGPKLGEIILAEYDIFSLISNILDNGCPGTWGTVTGELLKTFNHQYIRAYKADMIQLATKLNIKLEKKANNEFKFNTKIPQLNFQNFQPLGKIAPAPADELYQQISKVYNK